MEAVLWAPTHVFAAEHSGRGQAPGSVLHGIAASPGVYTGPAHVILNESEFAKLQPGDVPVCPITSPVWSVLFPSVGALVTDTGGILSHPAIIAREYRVPAVVATGNATRLLRDGQSVAVDGNAGANALQPQNTRAHGSSVRRYAGGRKLAHARRRLPRYRTLGYPAGGDFSPPPSPWHRPCYCRRSKAQARCEVCLSGSRNDRERPWSSLASSPRSSSPVCGRVGPGSQL